MADQATLLRILKGIGYERGDTIYDSPTLHLPGEPSIGPELNAAADLDRLEAFTINPIIEAIRQAELRERQLRDPFGARTGEGGLPPLESYLAQRGARARMDAEAERARPPGQGSMAGFLGQYFGGLPPADAPDAPLGASWRGPPPAPPPELDFTPFGALPGEGGMRPGPGGGPYDFGRIPMDIMSIGEPPAALPPGQLPPVNVAALRDFARTSTPQGLPPAPPQGAPPPMGPPLPPGMGPMGVPQDIGMDPTGTYDWRGERIGRAPGGAIDIPIDKRIGQTPPGAPPLGPDVGITEGPFDQPGALPAAPQQPGDMSRIRARRTLDDLENMRAIAEGLGNMRFVTAGDILHRTAKGMGTERPFEATGIRGAAEQERRKELLRVRGEEGRALVREKGKQDIAVTQAAAGGGRILPAGELAAYDAFERFQSSAQKIRGMAEKMAGSLGPIDNAIDTVAHAIGWQAPEVGEFRRLVSDELNRYIRDMTGAQLSKEESERLQRGMPTLTDTQKVFLRKLKGTLQSVEAAQERWLRTRQEAGYRVPGGGGGTPVDRVRVYNRRLGRPGYVPRAEWERHEESGADELELLEDGGGAPAAGTREAVERTARRFGKRGY